MCSLSPTTVRLGDGRVNHLRHPNHVLPVADDHHAERVSADAADAIAPAESR
jgi:hypothetical protein